MQVTVEFAAERWFTSLAGRMLSNETIKNYQGWICFFLDQYGQKSLKEVDRWLIDDVVAHLVSRVKSSEISKETAFYYQYTLKRFFRWCAENELIESNPAAHVRAKRPEKKLIKTAMQITSFQNLCNVSLHIRDKAILLFMGATGCRPSELISLQTDGVDMGKKEAIVNGKVGERTVQFDNEAAVAMSKWLVSRKNRDAPFVFYPLTGKNKEGKMTLSGLRSLFRRLVKKAGIDDDPRVSPKYIRHLVALLTRKHSDIETTRQRLGHKRLETTRIYAPADDEEVREVMAKTSAILNSAID